jgi:hypothetical protein
VTIFANPQAGEFVSVGASAAGSGGYERTRPPIGTISTDASDQPRIRFTTGGFYEVQFPGGTYDRLVPYGNGTDDSVLTTAARASHLVISEARDQGYQYSELAEWTSDPLDRFGAFGFGVPTPQGAVPVTGSATYSGIVSGKTDIFSFDLLAGAYFRDTVSGTVDLDFNFAQGSLTGTMSLSLHGFEPIAQLGTFAFTDTVFSTGSTTYSGRFDTATAGQNFFLGRFTGPHAEETIGAWAVPFIYSQGADADHQAHQAFGAWIAKKP